MFGPQTLYIDVKKRMKGGGIVTIPDAYLIDMTTPDDPKLYIIENEIVKHDPFKHIGIQILKFVTSFDEGKMSIRNFLMEAISNDPGKLKRLELGCSESSCRNIDNYLDQAVFSQFRGLVIIDEARPELHLVLEKINADISVLELKAYYSGEKRMVYHYDSLYEDDEEIQVLDPSDKKSDVAEYRKKKLRRRAEADTIIVPAREEGFKEEFLGNSCWYQIRIGAAMKSRIKYIAAYQVAPISAVTHIAEIQEIKPFRDTGKYIVFFRNNAEEIDPIPISNPNNSPQGPVYVKREKLLNARSLEEALEIKV